MTEQIAENAARPEPGEACYVAHGWSGCAGSEWGTLTQATKDAWAHAERAEMVANSMQHFADVADVCERKSNEYATRLAAVEAIIGPDEVFPDWSQYPHRHRVSVRRRDLGGVEVTTTMVEERAVREALKHRPQT